MRTFQPCASLSCGSLDSHLRSSVFHTFHTYAWYLCEECQHVSLFGFLLAWKHCSLPLSAVHLNVANVTHVILKCPPLLWFDVIHLLGRKLDSFMLVVVLFIYVHLRTWGCDKSTNSTNELGRAVCNVFVHLHLAVIPSASVITYVIIWKWDCTSPCFSFMCIARMFLWL